MFADAFSKGVCSYRIKMEDGIPGQVYEAETSKNSSGQRLLRPTQDVVPWKWHPLFLKTEGIFDLLDRKLPA
jgi:hypothetical protein